MDINIEIDVDIYLHIYRVLTLLLRLNDLGLWVDLDMRALMAILRTLFLSISQIVNIFL